MRNSCNFATLWQNCMVKQREGGGGMEAPGKAQRAEIGKA